LEPQTDAFEVRRMLRRTGEARRLLDEAPDVSIGGARDVRPAVGRARLGGVLEAQLLLEIADTLASMRRLRQSLLKQDPQIYAQLRELAQDLPNLPALEAVITGAIGDDGTVLDSASPLLGRLRAEIRIAYNRLQERLQAFVSSSQYAPALQEAIITVRNGRYVVPVKATHRRTIRGLVHDQSASGATLYVEPIAVLELNNRMRELQAAEEEEVQRILAEITEKVAADADAIQPGVESLALLDLAFAMAKYANDYRSVEPEIIDHEHPPDGPLLRITQARHPLIERTKVVPIDLWLGGEFRLLLITGPNTGGKTVALKTTGLLALMAQAGMHIPAGEPSQLPIFGRVFADIGDEQSIEQSLSTFSSHMSHIIRILRALDTPPEPQPAAYEPQSAPKAAAPSAAELEQLANWRKLEPGSWAPLEPLRQDDLPTLVLLDELGAGTDPVEGAALARAIVERLLERGVLGVMTTHYAELKAFAYATPGVQNGSVEFDVETLAPTYRLTIGLPGRSNALAIAARLGLEGALVERARATMAREDAQVEDLLAAIHREREVSAQDLKRADELRADAEKYRDRLAAELREFEQQREDAWRTAREELEAEFREARGQLRRLRDEFRSVTISRQWLEEAEQRLVDAREYGIPAPPEPRKSPPPPAAPVPRPLQIGDTVMVRSVGLMGEILEIDEEEQAADVQVGGFRMRAALDELRREKQEAAESFRRAAERRPSMPVAPEVSLTLDMRGWRASEVAARLDRYLNDAYLAGMPFVRIVHGKGTGALRQVVRQAITGHPLVKSFSGGGSDGGEGVTVVYLAVG
jgi:DNA mismatch repair protein MutS2